MDTRFIIAVAIIALLASFLVSGGILWFIIKARIDEDASRAHDTIGSYIQKLVRVRADLAKAENQIYSLSKDAFFFESVGPYSVICDYCGECIEFSGADRTLKEIFKHDRSCQLRGASEDFPGPFDSA